MDIFTPEFHALIRIFGGWALYFFPRMLIFILGLAIIVYIQDKKGKAAEKENRERWEARKRKEWEKVMLNKIEKGVCPQCRGKLEWPREDTWDRICKRCQLYFKFMDDPGPNRYVQYKLKHGNTW